MSQNNGVVCSFKAMNDKINKIEEQMGNEPKGKDAGKMTFRMATLDEIVEFYKILYPENVAGLTDNQIKEMLISMFPDYVVAQFGMTFDHLPEVQELTWAILHDLLNSDWFFYDLYSKKGFSFVFGFGNFATFGWSPIISISNSGTVEYYTPSFEFIFENEVNMIKDDYFCPKIQEFIQNHIELFGAAVEAIEDAQDEMASEYTNQNATNGGKSLAIPSMQDLFETIKTKKSE